jgi:hypothetical protein
VWHAVATVPAYRWLWSSHDVVLGHRRRYSAARLRAVVEAAGFTVASLSYFNTLLLPMIALVRTWRRLRVAQSHDLVRPRATVNAALARVFALEAAIVPRWPLPCGASVLVIGWR